MNAWFGMSGIGLSEFLLIGATYWGRIGLDLLARWRDKGRHWDHDHAPILALKSEHGKVEAAWNDTTRNQLVQCRE